MDSTLNPFKKVHWPSIFNENLEDQKMLIPGNKEIFDNIIRAAFTD
jgi:hypothetical protein